jgi:hypothetical protein
MRLKKIPMNHHQNVIQFNKIQKTFIQINEHFLKFKKKIMYVIQSTLRINFIFFHLDKYQ